MNEHNTIIPLEIQDHVAMLEGRGVLLRGNKARDMSDVRHDDGTDPIRDGARHHRESWQVGRTTPVSATPLGVHFVLERVEVDGCVGDFLLGCVVTVGQVPTTWQAEAHDARVRTSSTKQPLTSRPWWVQLRDWFQFQRWRKAWTPLLRREVSRVVRAVDITGGQLFIDLISKVEGEDGLRASIHQTFHWSTNSVHKMEQGSGTSSHAADSVKFSREYEIPSSDTLVTSAEV